MALTRSFLNGMGLTAEQVSAIIEAHAETVDGLKAERDGFKENAEKLPKVESELKKLKEAQGGTDEWKDKYEKLDKDFSDYKSEQTAKELTAKKSEAYQSLLKEVGISEKRISSIVKLANLNEIELESDGKIKGCDELKKSVAEEWSDFIVDTDTQGADTKTPPDGNELGGKKPSVPTFF